jgi:hypothetical protein
VRSPDDGDISPTVVQRRAILGSSPRMTGEEALGTNLHIASPSKRIYV